MSFAMIRDEREALLAGVHVGVMRIACDGQAALSVPICCFSPKPMAQRDLGTKLDGWHFEENASERSVVFTLRPERWRTVDYAKLAATPRS